MMSPKISSYKSGQLMVYHFVGNKLTIYSYKHNKYSTSKIDLKASFKQ